ncbi:MAG: crossover junction endodeoxyribonuclease RuvC [Treponema sp.]|nr:crossover junction endodeoxyribonuclease RuvC [Treponema sp.]
MKATSDFSSLPGTTSASSDETAGKKIKRVLGIDPGLANTGFGVVDFCNGRYRMVSYGCISTKSTLPLGQRLLKIHDDIQLLINEFKPSEACMEELFFVKNVTSGIAVAEAKGIVTLCLEQNKIPLAEYKPNQIKQAVSGTVKADKKTVEQYVKILLGLEKEPKPDHAADALACAITHLHYNLKIC